MQFNVSSLLKEPTGASREYDIDDDARIDGASHHLRGRARFDRTTDGILVRATLSGTADGVCSRCLRPITVPITIEFDEEYIPTVDVTTGARVDLQEGEEEAYRIDARHTLDLGDAVAQYWSMALPMAPLCSEDCAGLCPVCGDEIAGAEHGCAREQVDARWAKLGTLKLG
jgi:uncharacterized protein